MAGKGTGGAAAEAEGASAAAVTVPRAIAFDEVTGSRCLTVRLAMSSGLSRNVLVDTGCSSALPIV